MFQITMWNEVMDYYTCDVMDTFVVFVWINGKNKRIKPKICKQRNRHI